MNWWFIALIIWLMLELGAVLGKHGEPKKGNYSFGHSLVGFGMIVFVTYRAILTGF